ncbi:MAG: cation transporter [Lachnospiraceae bacterium]|nr:cation transporter [Lachnospiraceae bacterium]
MSKENNTVSRDRVIVRTSIIGILTNLMLSGFKAAVGFISNSIAIILDAVNNLSDALSSVITIIGTKLASKKPDKKHPLGYGRIEYLTAMIIAAIVLYAGITSLVESVKKIISPEEADYSTVTLIIIGVAVLVKIVLGRYVKAKGKQVNSGSLIASGSDALFDAILSFSVLVSALIFIFTGVSLEAYVGVIISVVIIKAGIEMMIETLNEILGKRADRELSLKIKSLLSEEEGVRGAYDLIISNYGPDKDIASVHLELPDTMTVGEVDVLTRKAERKVYEETGVILTGVGVYSYNTSDDEAARIRDNVREIVMSNEGVIQMHGFYADLQMKTIRLDAVMSFDADTSKVLEDICGRINEAYPDYSIIITPDVDLSD